MGFRVPRRQKVPAEVRAAVPLARGERVLAACRSGDDGAHLVASDRALYVVGVAGVRRWRWDLIDRAGWQPPLLLLTAREQDDGPLHSEDLPADPDSAVPAVVRERVTNSILINNRVDVPGGSARLVARRDSDTGELRWRVVFGSGVTEDDPRVQQRVAAELADLRSRLGV